MALDANIVGGVSNNKQEVNSFFAGKVVTETNAAANPSNIGGSRVFSENDQGLITGEIKLASPEVDIDYRMRVSQDFLLDEEVFNYTAQSTGKYALTSTTMTGAFTAGQLTTNSGSITTTTTGLILSTYATFPNTGTQTLSFDTELGFSAQPNANSFVEFGLGLEGTPTTAPTDGVFFRLDSAGLKAIASNNGTETQLAIPLSNGTGTWAYTNNKKYQFIVYVGGVAAEFWVNDGTGAVKLATIPLPVGQGRICMAGALKAFIKHRITGGAAGSVLQCAVGAYNVRIGGSSLSATASVQGNRMYGSYQGLSGGTMGSLATYPNSTNPTAAIPTNTALTANLPAGLGGQGAVTAQAAAVTDLIWASYLNPAGTVNYAARRIVLRGVKISLLNMGAAVATTPTTVQFSIAFGHNAVSLATTETATTKAPRRIPIGFATWAVGTAIGAQPQSGDIILDFGDAPVFINPSEYLQLVGKFVNGTATASQVINFTWTPVYGWE